MKLDSTESWERNSVWYRDSRDPHTIPYHSTAICVDVECPECHKLRSITAFSFTQGKLRHRECAIYGPKPKILLDELKEWDRLKPYYKDKRDPHTLSPMSHVMIEVECPSCGEHRKTRVGHFVNTGPTCHLCALQTSRTESKLEMSVREVLEQLDLEQYELTLKSQWAFPLKTGGVPRTADFALLGKSNETIALLEVQGGQHYDYCSLYHSCLEDWVGQLDRDAWKRRFCLENGIPLLEVCYIESEAQRRHNIIGFLTTIGVLPLSAYEELTALEEAA